MIEIHPTAYVSPLADIEESVKGSKIIIGPNSYIDSFVKIKAAGGTGDIVIGSHSFINSGCVLYIGNGIVIEDDVWIGASSVLLDGAILQVGSVIGARSLVLRSTDPYGVYAGNPLVKRGERIEK
jgi:acetyltransferase-like isoleucine patch superfamily enzyme